MSLLTLDAIVAGMRPLVTFAKNVTPTLVAGRPHSLFYLAGDPGAGAMDNTTAGGVVLSSSSTVPNGIIRHYDPAGGSEARIARITAGASPQTGTILLCDRLWHGSNLNSGVLSVTSTAAQPLGSVPTWPARDYDGTTDGKGVLIGMEVYSALGAGTPTWTLTYTNSAGTTGKTATNLDAVVASSAVGAFYRFGLAAGDAGVRKPTSFQSSATSTSGNFGLVAYRVLASLPVYQANVANELDGLTGGFQKLHNGVCPFLLFVPNTTTAAQITGTLVETQG